MFQRNTELLKILVTANDEIMTVPRGGLRTAATSKVELFVIIVNGFNQSLTIITKSSTQDAAAVPDPPMLPLKCMAESTHLKLPFT